MPSSRISFDNKLTSLSSFNSSPKLRLRLRSPLHSLRLVDLLIVSVFSLDILTDTS